MSVGPSDTKREHGSSTGRHHVLLAPAGPKRRLLHTQSMEPAWIHSGQLPDLSLPFAGVWEHVVVEITETKHVENTPEHAVPPEFSLSPAGCNSSGL